MDQQQLKIKSEIEKVQKLYNSKRASIIKKAYENGGAEAVEEMETAYSDLVDAYYEIKKRELNENLPTYEQLTTEAISKCEEMNTAITRLESYSNIINSICDFVNIIGKIIIRFAD